MENIASEFQRCVKNRNRYTNSEYLNLKSKTIALRKKCGEEGHDFKMDKVVGVEYCTKCGKGRNKRILGG